MLGEVARVALATVSGKRATFTAPNVLAEVHRQLHGARFAHSADRLAVADRITTVALDDALPLTETVLDPVATGVDDRASLSRLRAGRYTTRAVLDAETRLLEAGRTTTGPSLADDELTALAAPEHNESSGEARSVGGLGADQTAAVTAIATSGRVLDVLPGAAGTGKTASLAALRAVWEQAYGGGSVLELAPSAAAAKVLADDLGIATDNTAKWLHEAARQNERLDQMAELIDRIQTNVSNPGSVYARRLYTRLGQIFEQYEQWMIRPGPLVIVDEAGLAGTLGLDTIVTAVAEAGGRVLLVGDTAQLGAVEAGGAFPMLVNDRPDAPELNQVRRFHQPWERAASLGLRAGDHAAIAAYGTRDRVRSGDRADMLDALYRAWRDDTARGLASVMLVEDRDSMTELNRRAQTDHITTGHVSSRCTPIANDAVAGSATASGPGTTTVACTPATAAGSRTATPGPCTPSPPTAPSLSTPPLKTRRKAPGWCCRPSTYASTTFRAQGRTVSTAHALITNTSTREALYVAATRGRDSNMIYVDTSTEIDPDTAHGDAVNATATEVLHRVADNTGADISAHAILERTARNAALAARARGHDPLRPFNMPSTSAEPWTSPASPHLQISR